MANLFTPRSVTWRVNQEPALLLGGGRALLMQVAHPGVAAGVAEHSDFRRRPVGRLLRTLALTLSLTFGTREQALDAARQINGVHRRVRGSGYSARDPRLLLWVHATLIDSVLVTYQAFVGPLGPAEREAYYQEAKALGGLLGIARAAYPPTLADFDVYLRSMLDGDELSVDGRARELAAAVLRPPLRGVPGLVYTPGRAVTAGLLPARLRRAYRLPWGRGERLLYAAVRRGVTGMNRVVPAHLRQLPPARRAATLRSLTNRSG
jgi:uncharacterized protein (DUF2236 family)